jgi:predicted ABC-type sugar transport system permease subunit
MTPVFEQVKTVYTLDRIAAVICGGTGLVKLSYILEFNDPTAAVIKVIPPGIRLTPCRPLSVSRCVSDEYVVSIFPVEK